MPQFWPAMIRMRLLLAILALAGASGMAAADSVPLPRARPPIGAVPQSLADAAARRQVNAANRHGRPTACDARLAGLAAIKLLPPLIGPGACGNRDMVEVKAVLLPDARRIAVEPPAVLNCAMAESLAAWLREEAAPRVAKLGSPLTAIENYDSYACRTRNRVPGAKLSEHAHGDALDLRALHLADGRRLQLSDVRVDKALRVALRDGACHRFTTVLGPGADGHHNGHIHLDVIQRRAGYRICEWDVRGAPPRVVTAVPLPRPRPGQGSVISNR
jgi:hypothetical protein